MEEGGNRRTTFVGLSRAPRPSPARRCATDDGTFMWRALRLAERGRRTTSPNPMVGCVIARDGDVVGEGFHERAGGPHAEIVALDVAGTAARGATVYVTLEPCNHTGRTGPCSEALVAAGVGRVVIAVQDPHELAAGGAQRLREAGIEVSLGVLGAQAARLNEAFFFGVRTGRPLVVAKVATSLDGRIAAADGSSRWLTGEAARTRVHRLRAEVDAVLVGSGTVLADDPRLTVRLPDFEGPQPARVVLDRRGRVPATANVFDREAATYVLAHDSVADALADLWRRNIRSVLVEGGATVLHAFLAEGLVDRLHVHIAPVLLGERGRPVLAGPWAETLNDAPRFTTRSVEREGDDVLLTLTPAGAQQTIAVHGVPQTVEV